MNKFVKVIEKKFIVYSLLFFNVYLNYFLSNYNIFYKKYYFYIKRLFFNLFGFFIYRKVSLF